MISVNLSASCGATGCHITCVEENPCSSNSGGPLPPTRAKMRPDEVLIHSDAYPGNRSARSDMDTLPHHTQSVINRQRVARMRARRQARADEPVNTSVAVHSHHGIPAASL